MAITVQGAALHGVDAIPIEVEVDLLRRLPAVCVVGLAASAVKESSERIRSAMASADLDFPRKRVVVNLAPADVRKTGTAFDLPIALGILAADDQVPIDAVSRHLAVGELALGGELRPIRGALSMAMLAREQGLELLLPRACAAHAAMVPGVKVRAADSLAEVVEYLRGERALEPVDPCRPVPERGGLDLREVRGQALARRALEVAAAGAHHLLMVGPPGCGKTMLAQRLPSILPPMDFEEALDATRVHSAAGVLREGAHLLEVRPFRAPHHTVTRAGLVGDRSLRPGEVSLAHNGVLFLDEAAEFSRTALEVLRQPLEDGVIQLTRAGGTVRYPAAVTLVLASNPCPCGNLGFAGCLCGSSAIAGYRRRLSGPILDRIDLHVRLEPVSADALLARASGEPSAAVRERVVCARDRQLARGQECPNGRLDASGIERWIRPEGEALVVLEAAVRRHQLSGRATTRVLKVARTVADLADSDAVGITHLAEALAFRPLEEAA